MTINTIDLSWGVPIVVAESLGKILGDYNFTPAIASDFNVYSDNNANLLKTQIVQHMVNTNMISESEKDLYDITVTNGATGAINLILQDVICNQSYYNNHLHNQQIAVFIDNLHFSFYQRFINNIKNLKIIETDLNAKQININTNNLDHAFVIIDSPSNPLGVNRSDNKFTSNGKPVGLGIDAVIWDAVYQSSIYHNDLTPVHYNDFIVGSMSKYLGLPGLRIGFIAVKKDNCFNRKIIPDGLSSSYYEHRQLTQGCGLSMPSINMALKILNFLHNTTIIDKAHVHFEKLARNALDSNRDTISKISTIIGSPVQDYGMFYTFESDKSLDSLFESKGITITKLNNYYRRINIGQSHSLIEQTVKRIV